MKATLPQALPITTECALPFKANPRTIKGHRPAPKVKPVKADSAGATFRPPPSGNRLGIETFAEKI